MYSRTILTGVISLAALLGPKIAGATSYVLDCGAGGPSSTVQSQVDAIGLSPNNTILVKGSCVGDLRIYRADRLSITRLNLNGNLSVDSSVTVALSNLNLTGGLYVANARGLNVQSATVIRGAIEIIRGSQISFTGLSMSPWSDAGGTSDPVVICSGQSECSFSAATVTGSGTGGGTGIAGIVVGSASRLNLYSGTISGFDIGVWVWNSANAFLTPTDCTNLTVQSNLSQGVHVSDGGLVKIEGLSPTAAANYGCSAVPVYLTHNGAYGVFADGGGNAYLYRTAIAGHSVDGIRVQHGSAARVRSSTIDAASASGRSARVTGEAHLYFDEQADGPAASSTLAGPVCVTGNSSVDTDNSSTVITTTATCSTP